MMETKMIHKTNVVIQNKLGLHARPAAMFVELASKFMADITVEKDGNQVNGKSIMGIMMLAAGKGTTLTLIAEGDDAHNAIKALSKLIKDKFNED